MLTITPTVTISFDLIKSSLLLVLETHPQKYIINSLELMYVSSLQKDLRKITECDTGFNHEIILFFFSKSLAFRGF